MQKKVLLGLLLFYVISFLIFLNPISLKSFLIHVYNADLLFPFSIYNSLFNPASKPDWVFGGYTPFFELLMGFLFWLLSRNIQYTFLINAIFQHAMLTLSMLYVLYIIVGKNIKFVSLTVLFSVIPIWLYSSDLLKNAWLLFSWYTHVTTTWMVWLAVGLLIKILTGPFGLTKNTFISLLLLSGITIISVMSDALFIAQFTIPAFAIIILFLIFRLLPFRKAVYLGLVLLYSTAGGLALYRLPSFWGSERLVFYGSYFKPTIEQVLINIFLVIKVIPSAWENSPWISAFWIGFYAFCLFYIGSRIPFLKKGKLGYIQNRLMIFFVFLLFQLITNIGSGLTTISGPGTRYFLPIIYTPLFWGWPFMLITIPGWMKHLQGKKNVIATSALPILALLILFTNNFSLANLNRSANDIPDFVQCLDEKSTALNLQRGMANYWQARPVTLFSKTGLVVVQVDPSLTPFRILNNSDGYAGDFDFVIISNDFRPGYWMDRNVVITKFGPPETTFFCEKSEILVYNMADNRLILSGANPKE